MDAQEVVSLALRVLSAWNKGQAPDPGEVALLRQAASPEWPTGLDIDELAYLGQAGDGSRRDGITGGAQGHQERLACSTGQDGVGSRISQS